MEIPGSEALDVIVVGAGNAATCAALSARENGALPRLIVTRKDAEIYQEPPGFKAAME